MINLTHTIYMVVSEIKRYIYCDYSTNVQK